MYQKYLGPVEAIDRRIEAFWSLDDLELRKIVDKNKPTLWRRLVSYAFDEEIPEWIINHVAAYRILTRRYNIIKYKSQAKGRAPRVRLIR